MLENAFSPDGMIVRQSLATDVPYGRYPSSRNGCGWIATYHLLRAVGRPQTPEAVRARLAKTLLFGGRFGTQLYAMLWMLHRAGVRFTVTFSRRRILLAVREGRSGLLLYRWKRYGHYIVFTPGETGERLLNCSEYESGSARTLDGLFKMVRPWLTAAVIVKEDRP